MPAHREVSPADMAALQTGETLQPAAAAEAGAAEAADGEDEDIGADSEGLWDASPRHVAGRAAPDCCCNIVLVDTRPSSACIAVLNLVQHPVDAC